MQKKDTRNSFKLWENEVFTVTTPLNPHIPYNEGLHLVVAPKKNIANAWGDENLAGKTFELAAKACAILEELKIAPWFNIQANGNWGLLPGATPSFHIHIYGRNKTKSWAKPIVLPELPETFRNDPMPEEVRKLLQSAFGKQLINY